MANVKNFGLVGVGSTVQFGKAGPSLGQQSATILKADGTAAFKLPAGTAGEQPQASTAGAGGMRFNSTTAGMEFSNGTNWISVATGGTAVTSVTGTTDRITITGTSTEPIVDIASTYVGQATITTLGTVATGTWQADTVAAIYGGTGQSSYTTGDILYASSGTALSKLAIGAAGTVLKGGTTPSYSAVDLTADVGSSILPGANGGTGVDNGTDTITTTGNVSFGGTVSTGGNLTLADDFTTVGAFPISLTAVAGSDVILPADGTLLSTTSTYVASVTSADTGRIVIGGTATDPTVDLATVTNPGNGGTFVKVTTDAYGRVSNSTAVVTSDITALVDATYVNIIGDTMTGDLNMGSFYVTMNSAPVDDTDGANKAYVDAVAAGLSWKQAVAMATTVVAGNIPGFSAGVITIPNNNATFFPNGGAAAVIDGVTFTTNARVLVKNQTAPAENGIYVVTTAGVEGATDAVLTRSLDMDAPAEFTGATVFVTGGTVNDNSGWTQTEIVTTVNTSPNVWSQFSGSNTYTWGTGLVESGNTVSVNLGAGITELPSDEVGIHLHDSANNPLILTLDGTTRSTDAGAALGLLLDGSSLSKSTTGLRVAAGGVDLTTMVTGILPGANGGTGVANTGKTITLGGNLTTSGAFNSTFVMTADTNVTFPTTGTLATTDGTVASFATGATGLLANGVNTAVTGAVVLTGTLATTNGGTGKTAFVANELFYAGSTSTMDQSANLAFDGTSTLTVGGAAGLTFNGATGTISSTAANGDINLVPTGTGSVVIGPSGAGQVSSETGQALTVNGQTGLTLTAGTSGNVAITSVAGTVNLTSAAGDITMTLATGGNVTVAGVTAAGYASTLDAADLVNKYYVDSVVSSVSGDIKGITATVSLAAAGTFNIGAVLPASCTVLKVKANVTAADTGSGTLSVGVTGGVDAYMATSEVDNQTTGMYISETAVVNSGVQVIATVGGSPASGSVTIYVEYQIV